MPVPAREGFKESPGSRLQRLRGSASRAAAVRAAQLALQPAYWMGRGVLGHSASRCSLCRGTPPSCAVLNKRASPSAAAAYKAAPLPP